MYFALTVAKACVVESYSSMIYLDNHATTRCDPEVVERISVFHRTIRQCRVANTASAMKQRPVWNGHVPKLADLSAPVRGYWVSGATEANNLAVSGAARGCEVKGSTSSFRKLAQIRHRCGLTARTGRLAHHRVAPDANGIIPASDVIRVIQPDTTLVSVMWANNEIGTIQPVHEIGQACREREVIFT